MIKERVIPKRRLVIKSRYCTVDIGKDIANGLDLDNEIAVKASAVLRAREKRPRLIHKKYRWNLIWQVGTQVRLKYSWQ